MHMCLNNCFYIYWVSKVWVYHRSKSEGYSVKKDMDIGDQKLTQLLTKISSQVKPRSLKVLQLGVGDITYCTISTFVGYTSGS